MFFIAYAFKGQVHVFAGRVKIISHSSCRTSTILKYKNRDEILDFLPFTVISLLSSHFAVTLMCNKNCTHVIQIKSPKVEIMFFQP